MKMHPTITLDRVMEAVDRYNTVLDNPGICLACGADHDGIEPDACGYICEECEEPQVYGASEILIMIA